MEYLNDTKEAKYRDLDHFEKEVMEKINLMHGAKVYKLNITDKYIQIRCVMDKCVFTYWYTSTRGKNGIQHSDIRFSRSIN